MQSYSETSWPSTLKVAESVGVLRYRSHSMLGMTDRHRPERRVWNKMYCLKDGFYQSLNQKSLNLTHILIILKTTHSTNSERMPDNRRNLNCRGLYMTDHRTLKLGLR